MFDALPQHAVVNNIFAVFGLAGVLHSQRELVAGFFAFNRQGSSTSAQYQACH